MNIFKRKAAVPHSINILSFVTVFFARERTQIFRFPITIDNIADNKLINIVFNIDRLLDTR